MKFKNASWDWNEICIFSVFFWSSLLSKFDFFYYFQGSSRWSTISQKQTNSARVVTKTGIMRVHEFYYFIHYFVNIGRNTQVKNKPISRIGASDSTRPNERHWTSIKFPHKRKSLKFLLNSLKPHKLLSNIHKTPWNRFKCFKTDLKLSWSSMQPRRFQDWCRI